MPSFPRIASAVVVVGLVRRTPPEVNALIKKDGEREPEPARAPTKLAIDVVRAKKGPLPLEDAVPLTRTGLFCG